MTAWSLNSYEIANRNALPMIRRARDYKVFSNDGRTYLDLHRMDGRFLFGYSVPGSTRLLKNRIEQHVYGAYPHVSHLQYQRTLEAMLPAYCAFVLPDLVSCQAILNLLPAPMTDSEPVVSVWRPFTPVKGSVVFLDVPGGSVCGPFTMLYDRQLIASLPEGGQEFCAANAACQTLVKAGDIDVFKRMLPLLEAMQAFPDTPVSFQTGITHSFTDALGNWNEPGWSKLKLGGWRRQGPYLYHSFDEPAYAQIFRLALQKGVILSPACNSPSILPGLQSRGEIKLIESVLALVPEV